MTYFETTMNEYMQDFYNNVAIHSITNTNNCVYTLWKVNEKDYYYFTILNLNLKKYVVVKKYKNYRKMVREYYDEYFKHFNGGAIVRYFSDFDI